MATTGPADIIRAYRHLYRGLLRAVQYSKPARFIARDQLRSAFRQGTLAEFDQGKISNTLDFLRGAERERGIEHKILKNLLNTAWRQMHFHSQKWKPDHNEPVVMTAYTHYQMTVAMLNESMGLCLR